MSEVLPRFVISAWFGDFSQEVGDQPFYEKEFTNLREARVCADATYTLLTEKALLEPAESFCDWREHDVMNLFVAVLDPKDSYIEYPFYVRGALPER